MSYSMRVLVLGLADRQVPANTLSRRVDMTILCLLVRHLNEEVIEDDLVEVAADEDAYRALC
jgi:hypothetical protein